MTAPRYKNFLKHNYLVKGTIADPWKKEDLREIVGDNLHLLVWVLMGSDHWVFQLDSDDDRREFCDWVETVTHQKIKDRTTWPELALDGTPEKEWDIVALEMPCRIGTNLWDKLSTEELHLYIRGGGLPNDVDKRGKPDDVQ